MRRKKCALWVVFAVSTFAANASAQTAHWQYHSRSDETGFKRPLFRALKLSPQVPSELEAKTEFRGEKQLYAMLRYGGPGSIRVGVVMDCVGSQEFDLYVDSNRDHVILPKEKVAGTGKERRLKLNAEFGSAVTGSDLLEREVVFRRGFIPSSISFATTGYLEGKTQFGDKRVDVRRIDGDGDGLFASASDRIWFDLNQDGRWNGFSEQFGYGPILKLLGQRYQVRGNPAGNQLSVEALTTTGEIKLRFAMKNASEVISSISVMFVGNDGSVFTVDDLTTPVEIPTGQYKVGVLQLTLKDDQNRTPWHYVFSDAGDRKEPPIYQVVKDQRIEVDPIGELRFEIQREGSDAPAKPNTQVHLKPALYTGDGLLINSRVCGENRRTTYDPNGANVALMDESTGGVLSEANSGFA